MAFSISDQSNAEYIEMCIRRAGALPLTVYLNTPVDGHRLAELVNASRMRNLDRKSTRLNSSHSGESRMPSSA